MTARGREIATGVIYCNMQGNSQTFCPNRNATDPLRRCSENCLCNQPLKYDVHTLNFTCLLKVSTVQSKHFQSRQEVYRNPPFRRHESRTRIVTLPIQITLYHMAQYDYDFALDDEYRTQLQYAAQDEEMPLDVSITH